MFNYIKFATYQLIGFGGSVFKLNKFSKNPNNYSMEEKFKFLQNQAKNSLDLVDINLNILGKERLPKEPVLFVINHSSILDSFILFSSIDRPIGCIIADEPIWKNMPIVNKWAKLINCIYINRKNNREALKSISKASQNIMKGNSMAIFPEGDLTWVKDENALVSEFKSGALKIAYKAKCPIVPLVIKNSKNTYKGYQPIGKITSVDVEVEFLDPVYDHIKDPKLKSTILSEAIRSSMIKKIEEFNNK